MVMSEMSESKWWLVMESQRCDTIMSCPSSRRPCDKWLVLWQIVVALKEMTNKLTFWGWQQNKTFVVFCAWNSYSQNVHSPKKNKINFKGPSFTLKAGRGCLAFRFYWINLPCTIISTVADCEPKKFLASHLYKPRSWNWMLENVSCPVSAS